MPTYQYACTDADCGNRFELVQAFTDPAVTTCPVCSSTVRKVYGSVGVVFKGSGFYRNDSRSEGGRNGSSDSANRGSKDSDSSTSSSSKDSSNGSSNDSSSSASSSKDSSNSSSGSANSKPESSTSASTSSSSSSGKTTTSA